MENQELQQPINNDEVQNDEVKQDWDDLPEPPSQEPEQLEQPQQPETQPLHSHKCIRCGVDFTSFTKGDIYCDMCENENKQVNKSSSKSNKVLQDVLHDILLKGITKKFKDEPKLTVDKHTKISKEIHFTDILNTKYEVIEKRADYMDECETFADIARRGLDPNVSKDGAVYGIARRLEPKNVTIARMKADIDGATQELARRQQAYNEYVAQLEKQANQPQPTNEPKGEPK